MTYDDAPSSVRSLEQRLRNLEGNDALTQRRRIAMALVVVGQMLPEGAIKGGSAMALLYGRGTRFTRDLDAARVQPLARFRRDFEESLAAGWSGFTGRLIEKRAPRPPGIPGAYVMQPFEVRLDYQGRPWCTVPFELGHNEIGDADAPELRLASDLATLFTEVGLEAPQPVPVMRADHQVAQKLHAVSAEGSERARDLVDLQLLNQGEHLDLTQVAATCVRLFAYRRQLAWPPVIVVGEQWNTLYAEAAEGLDVLPTVEAAVAWANALVQRALDRLVRNHGVGGEHLGEPPGRRPLARPHVVAPLVGECLQACIEVERETRGEDGRLRDAFDHGLDVALAIRGERREVRVGLVEQPRGDGKGGAPREPRLAQHHVQQRATCPLTGPPPCLGILTYP